MYLFEFQSKLQRLNPRLYVDTRSAVAIPGSDRKIASIRLRSSGATNGAARSDVTSIDSKAGRYLRECEEGHIDEVIGGIPTDWVPEGDIFDPKMDRVRLLARGWRSLVLGLVGRKFCSLERAQRVFGCSGLGSSSYDRGGLDAKWRAQCPEQAKKKDGPFMSAAQLQGLGLISP